MSKTLGFFNLTGGLNTVQDYATINSSSNRTETPDMLNIEYYKLGGLQTMKGNAQIGNQLGEGNSNARVTCGYEYIVGNKTYMIVTDSLDHVYEYDKLNNTFILLTEGIDKENPNRNYMLYKEDEGIHNSRHCIIGYNNGVIVVNGYSMFYYNKVTNTKTNFVPKFRVTDTSTSVTTGENTYTTTKVTTYVDYYIHPNCVTSSQGRLFYGCNTVEIVPVKVDKQDKLVKTVITKVSTTTGSTTETKESVTTYEEITNTTYDNGMLIYSGVGLGTNELWTQGTTNDDAGAFKEFFEDTSNFTALGTWAEYVTIHKIQNTYILDCTGSLSTDWTLQHYSEYTTDSQQSYIKVNNGYYSYIKEAGGIYLLLSRSIYSNTYQGGDFSAKIKDSFKFLDTERCNEIYATYNPKKKYVMFYMPMTDNLTSEGEFNGSGDCFIMDLQTKSWLHRKVPQYVTAAFRFDDETYIGTRDGLVLQEFKGKTFNGIPIQFYYVTPPFLWGGGTNKTTTKEFRVKIVSEQSNHFYIESYRDGNYTAKSKRLVANVGDNLGGLIWDIGYNYPTQAKGSTTEFTDLGDCNPQNFTYSINTETYTINTRDTTYYQYHYTNKEGKVVTVYTYTPPYKDGKVLSNIPVYTDNTGTELDGYSHDNKYLVKEAGTKADHNWVEYKSVTSYAWNDQNPVDLCYKYEDTTYGTYYAWVNSDTKKCTTNIYKDSVKVLDIIGFNGILAMNGSKGALVGVKYSDYQKYWNTPNVSIDAYMWSNKTNTWEHTANGIDIRIIISSQPDGTDWNNHKGRICVFCNGDNCLTMYGIRDRNTSHDTYTTTYIEKPQDTEPTNYPNKSYTTSGSNIKIDILGVGNKTFTRYSAGDRGQMISDTNYYTESINPNVGSTAYSNSDLTTSYGNITARGTNTITVKGNVLTRYSNGNKIRQVPDYYKRYSIFENIDTITSGSEPVYNYPLLGEGEVPKFLTDSIWDYTEANLEIEPNINRGYMFLGTNNTQIDRYNKNYLIRQKQNGILYEDITPLGLRNASGNIIFKYNEIPNNLRGDAWLQQGYQTKRMLLPTQYFEVIQFRFSGGYNTNNEAQDYNDNICITGFEVDGIQLAETPMA